MLDLLDASLGWVPDELHRAFFAWKHRENPFGPSPAWVATDGADRRVPHVPPLGVRADGGSSRAVRAVDTATHPDHQGQGIFTALTLHALDALPRRASPSCSTPPTTAAARAT